MPFWLRTNQYITMPLRGLEVFIILNSVNDR